MIRILIIALLAYETVCGASEGAIENRLASLRTQGFEAIERACIVDGTVYPHDEIRRMALNKATQHFEELLRIDPLDGEVCYEIGRAYAALGDFEKALMAYLRASKVSEFYRPDLRLRLARLYYAIGDMESAQRELEFSKSFDGLSGAEKRIEQHKRISKKARLRTIGCIH